MAATPVGVQVGQCLISCGFVEDLPNGVSNTDQERQKKKKKSQEQTSFLRGLKVSALVPALE